jgi:hypothetical protein
MGDPVLPYKSVVKPFERHMVKVGKPDSFPQIGECDDQTLAKLVKHCNTDRGKCTSPHGRRINNFCIGSDPEFVLYLTGARHKTPAVNVGLLPGLSIGCDQNQRLGELRGFPTTSVVEHVASIMSSFRWMYRRYPQVRDLCWRAGAQYDGDGIGGHVHFGRKRPNREAEVAALDGLAHLFYNMRFFNTAEWDRRRGGDDRRQVYGQYGDIRPQLHGYEYRTLPSWLCSPLKAFVVLTASKLAVLDPELTTPWANRLCSTPAEGFAILAALARYFAARDDDAYLLSYILKHPTFDRRVSAWQGTNPDFRSSWGIPTSHIEVSRNVSNILPAVIQPHPSETQEMLSHLESFSRLSYSEAPAMFRETLPEGYAWLYDNCRRGINYGGAGDVLHNLVGSRESLLEVAFGGDRLQVSEGLLSSATASQKAEIRRMFPYALQDREHFNRITFGRQMMGVDGIRNVRKFLLHMGLFPLWTVDTVKESSMAEFQATRKKEQPKKPKTPRERIL